MSADAPSAIEEVAALALALDAAPPPPLTVVKLKLPLVSDVKDWPATVGSAFGRVNVYVAAALCGGPLIMIP